MCRRQCAGKNSASGKKGLSFEAEPLAARSWLAGRLKANILRFASLIFEETLMLTRILIADDDPPSMPQMLQTL
jgi:hypothetical protein